jgi:hypothetical protein
VYQHISHKLLGMVLEVARYDGQTDAMCIHWINLVQRSRVMSFYGKPDITIAEVYFRQTFNRQQRTLIPPLKYQKTHKLPWNCLIHTQPWQLHLHSRCVLTILDETLPSALGVFVLALLGIRQLNPALPLKRFA